MLTLGLSVTLRQFFRLKYYWKTIFRLKVSISKGLGYSSIGKTKTRDLRFRPAMCGQPKRNYLRRNGGIVTLHVLILFHSRAVSSALSYPFVRPGFPLICIRLANHYLGVYSDLGS